MTFLKNVWGFISKIFQPLFSTAVIVAVIYGMVSWYSNKNEVSVKYIEVAVNILNSTSTKSDKVLREWAVDTINEYAVNKITGEAKSRLINGELIFGYMSLTEGGNVMSGIGIVK
jgi:hypothetical protein